MVSKKEYQRSKELNRCAYCSRDAIFSKRKNRFLHACEKHRKLKRKSYKRWKKENPDYMIKYMRKWRKT